MKSLADLLGFLLLSTGSHLAAIDIVLFLARFAGRQDGLDATTTWLPLFVGLGVPAVIMLVGGVLLTPELGHK